LYGTRAWTAEILTRVLSRDYVILLAGDGSTNVTADLAGFC
jgi:hypothetical protein